jgi:hypothetical protein
MTCQHRSGITLQKGNMFLLTKTVLIFVFLLSIQPLLFGQKPAKPDSIQPGKGSADKQIKDIKEKKIRLHSDVTGNEPKKSRLIDSTKQNRYGDILNDDSLLNKRYPVWIPMLQVFGINAFVWSVNKYVLHSDFANVNTGTWNYNIQKGWEWDNDRFGVNFVGHPYSGTLSFNAGRSNGYNYFQSFGFSVAGSLMWEYFGENTRPSYNDIIYTPVNGALLGEMLYRLSSNILDDRTHGWQRASREVAAGLINPVRGLNRLMQGKSFRVTNKEVYQKEPLNISLYGGLHNVNDGNAPSKMLNFQFDYGNPFEKRTRKPFDFFRFRADLNFGVGRKVLDNVTGYGILFGKNSQMGKLAILAGGFQYYDYWDNKTFELGTIGFGGGVFTKLPINKTFDLYTNVHLAAVPFAGNSTQRGPDTTQVRDYNYGGGIEGKLESTINIGKFATASIVYYYYLIHTYVGIPGNNFISILKPRVTVRLYKSVNLGFEHFIYSSDRYTLNLPATHSIKTEQKIFLMFYLEDRQRKGRYN